MKKVQFEGWNDCVELTSGDFKLIVTTEVGPRIIGGFLGGSGNIFHVDPKLAGTKGASEWVNYGGHRLWHSPETRERTYMLDNSRIIAQDLEEGGVAFFSPTEQETGITKTIRIYPLGDNRFRVEHYLRNDGLWDVELAAWSISVMAPGGVAVIPQSSEVKTGLLPTKFVSVWPYTDMNDPRITWGEDFVFVRQDPEASKPCKIGLNCEEGWVAYINRGIAFVKYFDHFIDGEYPDNGCSAEVYTCNAMLEAESLSPLYLLAPGDEILHVEEWNAFETEVTEIRTEDDAVDSLTREKKTSSAKKNSAAKKTPPSASSKKKTSAAAPAAKKAASASSAGKKKAAPPEKKSASKEAGKKAAPAKKKTSSSSARSASKKK